MALSLDHSLALSDNRFMLRAFKYRLYPTKQQQRLLAQQLEECRWLYNLLLSEQRDAWEQRQESLRYYDQAMTLPILKATRPQLAQVNAQALQNVAVRLDLAFKAYFRRVKSGETPGYPRFRGKGRYDSITYPQAPSGCKLDSDGKRLRLHGVGPVKIVLHRPLEGTPKTATVRRSSTGKWYVCFSCECAEPAPLPKTGQHVGIDGAQAGNQVVPGGSVVADHRVCTRRTAGRTRGAWDLVVAGGDVVKGACSSQAVKGGIDVAQTARLRRLVEDRDNPGKSR